MLYLLKFLIEKLKDSKSYEYENYASKSHQIFRRIYGVRECRDTLMLYFYITLLYFYILYILYYILIFDWIPRGDRHAYRDSGLACYKAPDLSQTAHYRPSVSTFPTITNAPIGIRIGTSRNSSQKGSACARPVASRPIDAFISIGTE